MDDIAKRLIEAAVLKALSIEGVAFDWPEFDEEDTDLWPLTVLVPYGRVKNYYKTYCGTKTPLMAIERKHHLSLTAKAITPPLVKADVGDFVLPYHEHGEPEDLDVGIVTSKRKVGKNHLYGCRHVMLYGDLKWGSNLEMKLTEDDYGGYVEGFFRVLTRKEAIERIKIKFTAKMKSVIASASARITSVPHDLDALVKGLGPRNIVVELDRVSTKLNDKEF